LSKKKLLTLFVPVLVVVALDQFTKWLVRTNPELHSVSVIDGWLSFHYTQNPGMAMGLDLVSTPVISAVAIIATVGILIYVLKHIHRTNTAYLLLMGLILGGALGNITDRIFMGLIEGYGTVLEGHVVDFIHFNLEINEWPVFPYIFNVADIAISVSIISLLLFNKRLLPDEEKQEEEQAELDLGSDSGDRSSAEPSQVKGDELL